MSLSKAINRTATLLGAGALVTTGALALGAAPANAATSGYASAPKPAVATSCTAGGFSTQSGLVTTVKSGDRYAAREYKYNSATSTSEAIRNHLYLSGADFGARLENSFYQNANYVTSNSTCRTFSTSYEVIANR